MPQLGFQKSSWLLEGTRVNIHAISLAKKRALKCAASSGPYLAIGNITPACFWQGKTFFTFRTWSEFGPIALKSKKWLWLLLCPWCPEIVLERAVENGGRAWGVAYLQSLGARLNENAFGILENFKDYVITARLHEIPPSSSLPSQSFVKLNSAIGQTLTVSGTTVWSAHVNTAINEMNSADPRKEYTRFTSTTLLTLELRHNAEHVWMAEQLTYTNLCVDWLPKLQNVDITSA